MEIATLLLQAARPATLVLILVLAACNDDYDANAANPVELKAHAMTPNAGRVVLRFESRQILPLISSGDVLTESPTFVFGPQSDGAGLYSALPARLLRHGAEASRYRRQRANEPDQAQISAMMRRYTYIDDGRQHDAAQKLGL